MSAPYRVLILDDDEAIRQSCARILTKEGYEVTTAEDMPSGLKLIDKWVFDLIILDLVLPGGGLGVVKKIIEDDPDILVIIISAHGTVATAVEAMKLGAYSFLAKPFSANELRKVTGQAIEKRRLALENLDLRQELEKRRHMTSTVYRAKAMAQVMEIADRVAPTDSTVLLTGESGTGKSHIAHRIHEISLRTNRPFVTVDCGTLVETLFESELFGHVKGAFTGADSSKIGKFELAHTGTIFFDEISNISLDVQAKLLKAVDDRVISKVGSHRTIKVDVRILAATNQNLPDAIQQGRFREDLFYRLNVVSIHIPPLRERREDIPELIRFFLGMYNQRLNMKVEGLSPEAMRRLLDYNWPGNVRELANVIERLVVLGREGIVYHNDLAFVGWGNNVDALREDSSEKLQDVEKEHIRKILQQYHGRKSETAVALGIDRKTLRDKIKKYNLQ